MEDQGACQEVLRLHRLAYPDAGRATHPGLRGRHRRRGRKPRHRRNADPQLDEGTMGQVQRRGLRRRIQRVLQAYRSRLGRPARGYPDEGRGHLEYQALLFIPSHAPFDLFNRDARSGVQLYIKRVFVMGDCDQLMPRYLRFVKGVVDAQDMSLNVSREILQQDRQVTAIRRRLTRKILSTIAELQSKQPEDYRTLWNQFGTVLKEGLMSDFDNQDMLLRISSFASTHSDEELTTLADYVERMKDGQEQIFFVTGESREHLLKSPHLEAFKAKGYEVLL